MLKKNSIQSNVDNCGAAGITGWIVNISNPHQAMEVDIFIDDELVAHTTANLFRQDLFDVKLGNGKCAFNVPIPNKFWDGVEHRVNVQEAVTKTVLQGSPKTFKLFSNVRGAIDICDATGIFGWVVNESNPSQPVEIDIFIDGELVAHTTANLFRQDLFDAKLGNGNCAFYVSIPGKFWDGVKHKVVVQEKRGKLQVVRDFIIEKELIGSIDNFKDDTIFGWAAIKGLFQENLIIKILFNSEVIAVINARKFRADIKQFNEENHAFQVKLSTDVLKKIKSQVGTISLKCDNCSRENVNTFTIERHINKSEILQRHLANLIDLVDFDLLQKQNDLINDDETCLQERVFERLGAIDKQESVLVLNPIPNISPYVNYTMFRYRVEHLLGKGLSAYNQTMQWYLRAYSEIRNKYLIPLSVDDINYYNAPINQPLIKNFVSQATFHYSDLIGIPINQDLNNPNNYRLFVYKWAVEIAPILKVQDCLVPASYVEALKKIPFSQRTKPFALGNFAEIYYHHRLTESIRAQLDLNNEVRDRGILYAMILLDSFTHPEFNRYISSSLHEEVFKDWQEQGLIYWTVMEAARNFSFSSLAVQKAELVLQKTAFKYAMLQLGYLIDRGQSLSITKSGHRIHAAKLPIPKRNEGVFDVQIIGPFAKASGLGQACRLSADTLRAAGFSVNCVDFGLDNPALEGYSTDTTLGKLSHAKINLLHLNAESIPLAFAYLPDVFTGAYNIGYFFWELDSPAACHYLALELLNEVWVSSEYGREIYTPHTHIPVTNVGMTIEELARLDKKQSRHYVEQVLNIGNKEVVFLVIFDSFSFVQRKNPIAVITAFQQAFVQHESVRLLIKTQNRFFVEDPEQLKIWNEVDQLIATDTRIKVINQTLQYHDLLRLKQGCDVYVSLHRSEGWGFGMIEAMNLKVPVICTAYSGNMDFCNAETTWLVDYTLKILDPKDYIFVIPGQRWAEPSIETAAKCMQEAYSQPTLRTQKANVAYEYIRSNFSLAAIAKRYSTRVQQIFAELIVR